MSTVFADDYGFSTGDGTAALQEAINDPNADKIIVRDMGSPWLIDKQIVLKSNKEIVFEEGAVVQAKSGSFLDNDRAMIVGRDIENVKLTGQGSGENQATLKMNKQEYSSNQYGHVVSLLGVKDYEVSNLRLTGAGGDGLHIAGGAYRAPDPNLLSYSENGLVENIVSDNNRRQGLSIDSAKDLVVRNSSFTNTGGTEPSGGIYLEPTWDFESLENILIENVDVSNNEGYGIGMILGNLDDTSPAISVDFNNVTLKDSQRSSILVGAKYIADEEEYGNEFKGEINKNSPNGKINGAINFNNVNISNSDQINNSGGGDNPDTYVFVEGISGNQDDPDNLKVNFNGLNVNDPQDTTVRTTPIFIQGLAGDTNPQEIGNVSFNDATITGNYNVDVVRADLLRSDSNLNNVTGDVTVFNANERGAGSFFAEEDKAKNLNLSVVEGNGEAPSVPNTSVGNNQVPVEQNSEAGVLEIEETPVEEDNEAVTPESEVVLVEEGDEVLVEETPVEEEAPVEEDNEVVTPESEVVPVEEEVLVEEDNQVVSEEETPVEQEAPVEEDNEAVTLVEEGDEVLVEETPVEEEEIVVEEDNRVVSEEETPVEQEAPVEEDNEAVTLVEEGDEVLVEEDNQAVSEETPVEQEALVEEDNEVVTPESEVVPVEEEEVLVEEDNRVVSEEETPVEQEAPVEEDNRVASEEVSAEEDGQDVADSDTSTNPIDNSSFTEDLTSWNTAGKNISVVERSEGDRWVKIESATGGVYQDITEQIVPGKDYQISATTQLSESGTNGYIGIRFATETNELIDFQYVRITDSVLEEQRLDFTAPEEFARADVFAFKNNGSAAFFVDDLSLVETGNEEMAAAEDSEATEVEDDAGIDNNEVASDDSDVPDGDAEITEEDSEVAEVEDSDTVDMDNNEAVAEKGIDTDVETDTESSSTISVDNSSFTDELTGWNTAGENISVVERSGSDRWVEFDSAVGAIYQEVGDQLVAGENYQVSATAQLSESRTNGYIGIAFTTENNRLIDLQYAQVKGNASPDFQQLDFTAPGEFARAKLFALKNNASGALYVDDLTLNHQV